MRRLIEIESSENVEANSLLYMRKVKLRGDTIWQVYRVKGHLTDP